MNYRVKSGVKEKIILHVNNNMIFYLIAIFCLCFGMVIGIYSAKYIVGQQRDGLVEVINRNASILNDGSITTFHYFLRTLKSNLQFFLVLFVLGLTVIGLPLIYLVDVYKGFTLGFAFCFVTNNFGTSGLWLAIVGLIIFNIMYIPIVLFASVLAIENSIRIIQNGIGRGNSWFKGILSYGSYYIIIITLVIVINFIQCIIFPLLLAQV
ncbi:stage II sporulation protein M [Oceanirhabdus sp. W0125-5]|uniref:stage II sporulation protein M n=1 Tax=Oceanirhabdus sp. W0125-5 TaxID=2999116 RepID=UPI0022F34237|nr:stage II sporulation protein M [Oceanirhabdus sp. W0125-5]WBW95310.1 stage II sporulation protein M [Oceanirhabdus sp. W0125-5]